MSEANPTGDEMAAKGLDASIASAKAHMGLEPIRQCSRCACTTRDCSACVARTGAPCHWVREDLCSACAEPSDIQGWSVRSECAICGLLSHIFAQGRLAPMSPSAVLNHNAIKGEGHEVEIVRLPIFEFIVESP